MIDFIKKIKESTIKYPDKIAYRINNQEISFKNLWNEALENSAYLKKQGNKPVIIYGHKSVDMIISILACLLAKRCYIPVDIFTPIDRIKRIIQLSNASLLIKNESIVVNNIDSCTLKELKKYSSNEEYDSDNKIAYIIFTSGSTGMPKGVPISYDNLNNFCNWIGTIEPLNVYKELNVLNQASYSFDLSVTDLYYSLCYGHTLIALDHMIQNDYNKMFGIIKNNEINLMVITPTFIKLCLLYENFNEINFKNLKCIYFCGELLEVSVVKKIYERFPNIKIINAYGPTEATSAVSSILITNEMLSDNLLPVGNISKAATTIEVKNNEIILKGASVFNGYLGNISGGYYQENGVNCYHTGDIGYIKNNLLYCNGRLDTQIKYKGYRIELNDIENNIKKINGVIDAVVVAKKNENIVKLIKAFVILEDWLDIDNVKIELARMLPLYMVPKIFQKIDKFPTNTNGKIDRKKLIEL